MIKQKWVLFSKDGSKVLGTFDTEEEALKREKEVNAFKHQEEAQPSECGSIAMPLRGWVDPSITSFAALQSSEEAMELLDELQELNAQFMTLAQNILGGEGEDKTSELFSLVGEYSTLLSKLKGEGEEPLTLPSKSFEAATYKAAVRSAVKALQSLLEDKTVPQSIRAQVGALKEAFRKTGGDLESEAENDTSTSENEEDPAPLHDRVSESFGGAEVLPCEVSEGAPASSVVEMRVALIRPGWGNSRDNHYYSRELLSNPTVTQRFVGKKMYESDHRPAEKSTRTWVSTITAIEGSTSEGAPIARVTVHDPNFAQRIINLNSKGLLDHMECSILADAIAEKQLYKEGSRQGKKILDILEVDSVDWVTRAGAGGHALQLAESSMGVVEEASQITNSEEEGHPLIEAPIQEGDTKMEALPLEEIRAALEGTSLPQVSRARIEERSYETREDLTSAIERETAYVKELVGSGKPFAVGESAVPSQRNKSPQETQALLSEIDKAFGI